MPFAPGSIDVIIACHDAARTIVRAVDSALACPQVRQVIVSDDASRDGTADLVARHYAAHGSVTVLRAERNAGPAKARNRAMERVEAPWFAILDSDDFFLPGRFEAMAGPPAEDFDLWADNILFTDRADRLLPPIGMEAADAGEWIDVERFLLGNLGNFRRRRHQLGFCKPVFRTAFLRESGIRYDEDLRLGEDFVLVLTLLMAGARFRFTRHCGYVAIERSDSLSAMHGIADLERLLSAEERLFAPFLEEAAAPHSLRRAFARRLRETRCKVNHVKTLARRQESGVLSGMTGALSLPEGQGWDVAGAIAADKLRAVVARLSPSPGSFAYYLQPAAGFGA